MKKAQITIQKIVGILIALIVLIVAIYIITTMQGQSGSLTTGIFNLFGPK